jgi:DNA repair protein RecO (recombination protein O)
LGFGLQGKWTEATPLLDVKEGQFVKDKPLHPYFLEGIEAQTASQFISLQFYNDLENIQLNGQQRKKILELFQLSLSWHYKGFKEIKSLAILQAVLH